MHKLYKVVLANNYFGRDDHSSVKKGYHHDHQKSEEYHHMKLKDIAEKWVKSMRNEKGTDGMHWSYDQIKTFLQSKETCNLDPCCWFVAMNMMYNDYMDVIEHFELNDAHFCYKMAKDFLLDIDSVQGEEKLLKYYCAIVKK